METIEKASQARKRTTGKNTAALPTKPATSIEKRLYTLKEAALYLGRSVDALREVIWARKLPIVRDGRKIWVDIRDLETFVARHKSAA